MGEKIALGFHTCVDYELIWDPEVIRKAIRDFGIRSAELEGEIRPDSERNVWRMVLAYMKAGIGAEILPDQPEIVNAFADRFQYRVTIGGTAARAAIALAKIGYTSVLSMSSYNEWIAKLLPPQIRRFSNTGNAFGPVFPHASFTYLGGQTIEESDICFTTARENRILISRDEESARLAVSEDFAPELADAEVFLLSCFSQILDADVLADRIGKTHRLLSRLSENAVSIMEDGNYVNQSFRTYVHQHLRDSQSDNGKCDRRRNGDPDGDARHLFNGVQVLFSPILGDEDAGAGADPEDDQVQDEEDLSRQGGPGEDIFTDASYHEDVRRHDAGVNQILKRHGDA